MMVKTAFVILAMANCTLEGGVCFVTSWASQFKLTCVIRCQKEGKEMLQLQEKPRWTSSCPSSSGIRQPQDRKRQTFLVPQLSKLLVLKMMIHQKLLTFLDTPDWMIAVDSSSPQFARRYRLKYMCVCVYIYLFSIPLSSSSACNNENWVMTSPVKTRQSSRQGENSRRQCIFKSR